MTTPASTLPRLPVFGWSSLSGARSAGMPCLLDRTAALFTTSGRASLLLALEHLRVGAGDVVLLPTYHCPTMVAPAVALGATPFFYPIDEEGRPQLAWLQTQDPAKVRVMVVAHYFGLPQPMSAIRAWCDARGIALLEDCAHAMFGRSEGRPIGQWGDVAIGSLPKFLPVPDGGCLVSNGAPWTPTLAHCGFIQQAKAAFRILEDGALNHRLRGLGGVANLISRIRSAARRASSPAHEPHLAADAGVGLSSLGADFRIDGNLAHRRLSRAAQSVAARLPRKRIVDRRRARYADLVALLSGHIGLRPLRPDLPEDCAPYVFPLWVEDPDPGYAEMRRRGEPVFRWDRRWPGIDPIPGDSGQAWSHHVLQLACHQDLPDDSVERYARTIVELFAHT